VGGGAVLADFGLARKQVSLITQQSVFAGTPPYMAPELFGGEGGPPSDQYALALTFIHLRQGRHPLKLLPYPQIMTQHLGGEYDLDEFITPDERTVLMTALDQVPTNRFPSCQDFARALADALGLPFQDRRKRLSSSHKIPAPQPIPSGPLVELESLAGPPGRKTEVREGNGSPLVKTAVGRGTVSTPVESPKPAPRPPSKLVPLVVVGVLVLALGGLLALVLAGGGTDIEPPDTGHQQVDPIKAPVVIEPDTPRVRPTGTEPFGGEVEGYDGRLYNTWVVIRGPNADIGFRFIPPTVGPEGKQIGPLYLMEEKANNRLVTGEPYANPAAPTAPAVGMTRAQAEAVAAKVVPGGRLPSPAEWDAAVGFFNKPRPAALAKGTPIVNVAGPGPSRKGNPTADLSHYGLLDTAGNGCEWTSGTLPGERPRAITRGRNFLFKDPLTFVTLDAEQKEPKAAFADQGNTSTGFRIAIPVPLHTGGK